jgi:uncharacterized protein YdiU (UPF0061 family)
MQHRPSLAHQALGPDFYDPVDPAQFPQAILRYRNQRWAGRVGLGELSDSRWLAHFGRFEALPGSFERPLALRYHGHQFRSYNPDLGDGRGFLFAQLHDLVDGRLLDLGTKGSGRTPWSRSADGRLTLKGGVREVLATAMLEALGVDTSKSLSLIETGEALERHDEPSPTRAGVLTRLSHSHIRIGTFQRLAYLNDTAGIERLVHHTIGHYFPGEWPAETPQLTAAFLARVVANVARTGAQWFAAGFVHGVLNTDNINVTGESFDYGPWRFLPTYDPDFTAAYFDTTGLYAFGRQPETLAWNLTRLAGCLLELAPADLLEPALNTFWPEFRAALATATLRRLGLKPGTEAQNGRLIAALYEFMAGSEVGFERVFFDWRGGAPSAARAAASPAAGFYSGEDFAPVAAALEALQPADDLNLEHPYFARAMPRTMLIDEMEALWAPIAEGDDWGPLYAALDEIDDMRVAYGN